ncbi:hypothetical protein NL676_006824 [Syzygium grande]|nr:hypothetical protein NL676_006824 [Syzygium grande]
MPITARFVGAATSTKTLWFPVVASARGSGSGAFFELHPSVVQLVPRFKVRSHGLTASRDSSPEPRNGNLKGRAGEEFRIIR